MAATRPVELTAEKQVDEAVFQQAFIPRKLEEVDHFERDAQRLLEGKSKDIYFTTLTGMAPDGTGAGTQPKVLLASQGRCSSAPETIDAADSDSFPQDVGLDDAICKQSTEEPAQHAEVEDGCASIAPPQEVLESCLLYTSPSPRD